MEINFHERDEPVEWVPRSRSVSLVARPASVATLLALHRAAEGAMPAHHLDVVWEAVETLQR